jgi:hypothetical protein
MPETKATIPPSPVVKKLQEKFAETIAGQADLLDHLARQLIALELALPGLYATVLKLVSGDKATLTFSVILWFAFGLWLAALLLTLASLFPRKWVVDREIMQQDPKAKTRELGIEDFFKRSARYKRWLLLPACLLFFAGIVCAAIAIF